MKFRFKPLFSFVMIIGLCLPLLACSQEDNESGSVATDVAAKAPMSKVMDESMNGSNVDAFKAGLEQVKDEATEQEYLQLRNAIGYMLSYDLSVKRSQELLYKKLDGKTPREIIDMGAKR